MPLVTIGDHYCSCLGEALPKYPIDIYQCRSCGHVQILAVVDPGVLFYPNYTYMPSRNPQLREHFQRYAELSLGLLGRRERSFAVDIGSNDGLYLSCLQQAYGVQVLGIEPAAGPCEFARSQGVETINDFFTRGVVERILETRGPASLVSANNVYAHIDDLRGFTELVVELLSDDGVFSFEFSSLSDVVEKGLVGTVFHEHLSTHSVLSLVPFLGRLGLDLIHVVPVPTQGGALIGFAKKTSAASEVNPSVEMQLQRERASLLDGTEGMERFHRRILADRRRVNELLEPFAGRVVAGFGAAISANTLVEFFDLAGVINYVVDDNPQKVGKFLNSGGAPICHSDHLREVPPDLVICLAWVHGRRITQRLKSELGPNTRVMELSPEVIVV
jgi:SAM-dependent methyltransferase